MKSHTFMARNFNLFSLSQRSFCYRWENKNRELSRPSSWNTPDKRSNSSYKMGKIKYRTQDPLFIDERLKAIEGGIATYIARLHDQGMYDLPLRNIAFILYNEAKDKRQERYVYK